jgi:HEAT repeats
VKLWRTLSWFPILIAAGVVVLTVIGKRQPHYAGRTLGYWVFQCADDSEAEKAVRAIGTNALPYLLDWIPRGRPLWKENLCHAISKVYGGLDYGILGRFYHSEDMRFSAVLQAFAKLGDTARPAVPELIRRLQDPKPEVWSGAMLALGYEGKDGLPPLIESLMNQTNSFEFRRYALSSLRHERANISPAIPALVKCLQDKNPRNAADSAMLLGGLGLGPDFVVPALTNCLQSSDQSLRWAAAHALGCFSRRASSAVSQLRNIILETDPSTPSPGGVREEAEEALFKIEREQPE